MLPIVAPRAAEAQPSPATADASTAFDSARPILRAVRITEPPIIDGSLSDEVWRQAHRRRSLHAARSRRRASPRPSAPRFACCTTMTRCMSARGCTTAEPAAISRRVTARDDSPDADYVTIFLDPRHDHRTGVSFTVTAAGVQRDSVISNDTFQDSSWDAVWTSAVSQRRAGMVGGAPHSVLAAALQCRRAPDVGHQRRRASSGARTKRHGSNSGRRTTTVLRRA